MEIKVIASSSKGNAYYITDGQTRLLLDAGLPIKRLRAGLPCPASTLAGTLITHEHGDHIKGAEALASYGVTIYATEGTLAGQDIPDHRRCVIRAGEQIAIGSFTVLPFEVKHDAAEPVGYLIYSERTKERLVYATDTYYLKYRFPALDYLMIECNYDSETLRDNLASGRIPAAYGNRVYLSHMGLDALLDMLAAANLTKIKHIYLLHLSDANADEAHILRSVQEATGAIVTVG